MSRQLDLVVQGSLGTNPIVSRTSSGRLFCYFRVATAPSFRVADAWREGPTIWFTAKAWGYLAENLARSLHKGDPVVLVGRFSQDAWENDRGQQLTNVLTVSCGGPDLTWGESRFMRVSHAVQAAEDEEATTSAGSAPSGASADAAPEPQEAPAVVGAQETRAPVDDTRWETPPGEAADQQGPTADPLSYTVREEALV
ncbi:MAG: single-stranded DNA-binding protein [Actinomyces sp.]|nr:MAG: single-stranded DNA-binding protein [Actinomyces sp.]